MVAPCICVDKSGVQENRAGGVCTKMMQVPWLVKLDGLCLSTAQSGHKRMLNGGR